jgi:hypothetical protein
MTNQNISDISLAEKNKSLINTPNINLNTFRISVIGEPRMYANGNQQCKIEIQAEKQIYNIATNRWETKPLSNAEIQNIKIVSYSSNLNASLPNGWFYDTNKNEYDIGIASNLSSAREIISEDFDLNTEALTSHNDVSHIEYNLSSFEIFNRYVRCRSSIEIQPEKLMATIRLENGETYSTHSIANQSSVTITPIAPYKITIDKLLDGNYERALELSTIAVDIYYWKLPNNLKIKNFSFGTNYQTHGPLPLYAFVNKNYKTRAHVAGVIQTNVNTLNVNQIYTLENINHNIPLRINSGLECLRIIWYSVKANSTPGINERLHCTITDNFGCLSSFYFESFNDYREVRILNG